MTPNAKKNTDLNSQNESKLKMSNRDVQSNISRESLKASLNSMPTAKD